MAVKYTSRKGRDYFLCLRINEKGQQQYVLARTIIGELVEKVPDGYEIRENSSGQVSIFKIRTETTGTSRRPLKQGPISAEVRSRPIARPGANPHDPEKYKEYPLVACPVCNECFPFPLLKWHIHDMHPHYTPENAIIASRLKDPNRHPPSHRRSVHTADEIAAKARKTALEIEQVQCGWCYRIVYRAWKPRGNYKYYDDESLLRQHKCTRPAHWVPDLD
jgi:hypothetical protein